MTKPPDNPMSITEFGDALIRTRDLDPVYVALHDAYLPKAQLRRWLLAYWCFYHMGAASWLSEYDEPKEFWQAMHHAARNEDPNTSPHALGLPHNRWPRASERRYFRGPKCVAAVEWLRERYPVPEDAVQEIINSSQLTIDTPSGGRHVTERTEKHVMKALAAWPLFGPWIGFKAADMLERCAEVPVSFSRDIGLIYSSPRECLDLVAKQQGTTPEKVWDGLLEHFASTPAPPALDRGCGVQECETLACKALSYFNGRYWVGKDILEIRHALAGWGPTAEKLLAACPPEVVR